MTRTAILNQFSSRILWDSECLPYIIAIYKAYTRPHFLMVHTLAVSASNINLVLSDSSTID